MGEPRTEQPVDQTPKISRRGILKLAGAGAITAVTTAIVGRGIVEQPAQEFKDFLQGFEAKTREEQERILKDQTALYIEEHDRLKGYNSYIQSPPREYSRRTSPEELREDARLLMEKGIALTAMWSVFNGEETPQFPPDGRLILEKRKLSVNEDTFDYHLAFSIIRTKLGALIEEDDVKKHLLEEDLKDMLDLADIHPNVKIEPNTFLIMPEEWFTNMARAFIILKKLDIPPPQKISISNYKNRPTGYNPGIAGAYNGSHGRFPQESQTIFITTEGGDDAAGLVHELGHYIADSRNIKKRLIGAKKEGKYPDFEKMFELLVSQAQGKFYSEKSQAGSPTADEFLGVVGAYAATNHQEDFADTFVNYVNSGPYFRKRIKDLKATNPEAAALLEARYGAMQAMLNGTIFSFDGHRADPILKDWEEETLAHYPYSTRTTDLFESPKNLLRFINERLRQNPNFTNAEISIYAPQDPDFAELLSRKSTWQFGERKIIYTLQYPIAHQEIKGKFKVKVPLRNGLTTDLEIDTNDPEGSAEAIKKLMPKLTDTSDITLYGPSDIPHGLLWPRSYPPSLVDGGSSASLHFQKINGKWEVKPVESREVIIREIPGYQKKDEEISRKDQVLAIGNEEDIFINLWGDTGTLARVKRFVVEKKPSPNIQ